MSTAPPMGSEIPDPNEKPKDTSPRMAKFLVNTDLLAEVLGLPKGHRIIQTEPHYPSPGVWLIVEGPDFPEVGLGERPPDVIPILTRIQDDSVPAGFRIAWDWNLEEGTVG